MKTRGFSVYPRPKIPLQTIVRRLDREMDEPDSGYYALVNKYRSVIRAERGLQENAARDPPLIRGILDLAAEATAPRRDDDSPPPSPRASGSGGPRRSSTGGETSRRRRVDDEDLDISFGEAKAQLPLVSNEAADRLVADKEKFKKVVDYLVFILPKKESQFANEFATKVIDPEMIKKAYWPSALFEKRRKKDDVIYGKGFETLWDTTVARQFGRRAPETLMTLFRTVLRTRRFRANRAATGAAGSAAATAEDDDDEGEDPNATGIDTGAN